jgi:hypothetical protein
MGEKIDTCYTGFLFSDPSFLKGMGTVFNIWGNYYTYNYSDTPEEADKHALASDWKIVGKELRDAIGETRREREEILEDA